MIEGSHDGHIFTVPQQADQRRERHRLRLPRDRRRTGTAGPVAALPRQPGQLGSRADRRAGAGPPCHNVRQRRSWRLERDNAAHRGDDPPCRTRPPTRRAPSSSTTSPPGEPRSPTTPFPPTSPPTPPPPPPL